MKRLSEYPPLLYFPSDPEIGELIERQVLMPLKYTNDHLHALAKQYTHSKAFEVNHRAEYQAARVRGLLPEFGKKYWTKQLVTSRTPESARKEALKYKTRKEMAAADPQTLQWIEKTIKNSPNKEEATKFFKGHFTKPDRSTKWSADTIRCIARFFTVRKEFETVANACHQAAIAREMLPELHEWMPSSHTVYTPELLRKITHKYETRTQLALGDPAAYRHLSSIKKIDHYCQHMEDVRKYCSDDELLDQALAYDTLTDLTKQEVNLYNTIRRRGLLSQVKGLLPPSETWVLGDPGWLYFWKIPYTRYYKIGICSPTGLDHRIHSVGRQFKRRPVEYHAVFNRFPHHFETEFLQKSFSKLAVPFECLVKHVAQDHIEKRQSYLRKRDKNPNKKSEIIDGYTEFYELSKEDVKWLLVQMKADQYTIHYKHVLRGKVRTQELTDDVKSRIGQGEDFDSDKYLEH